MDNQETFNEFKELENQSFCLIYGGRETGKSSAAVIELWNELIYKMYRTRISHRTCSRKVVKRNGKTRNN